MGTTTRLGIPYADPTDEFQDGAAAMQALAESLDGAPLGGWTNIGLAAGWAVNTQPRFRRLPGGLIVFEGIVQRTGALVSNIATMPVGSRPAVSGRWLSYWTVGGELNYCVLEVNAAGALNVAIAPASAAGGFIALNTILYVAV